MKATSTGGSSHLATPDKRTNMSVQHMLAAAHFTKLSASIESENTDPSEVLRTEHRAYVTGAILSAVASLESTINELFIDARDGNGHTFTGTEPVVVRSLAVLWNLEEVERARILRKYQLALDIARKPQFAKGESPYKEVDSLILLRNVLTHYKPEWNTGQKEHKKIEDRLRSQFELNPFSHTSDAFFPERCLGHGCAEWSVSVGVSFIDDFFKRLDLPPKFDPYQDRLHIR